MEALRRAGVKDLEMVPLAEAPREEAACAERVKRTSVCVLFVAVVVVMGIPLMIIFV